MYKNKCVSLLLERGVTLIDIAQITFDLQKKYFPFITLENCLESVDRVLEKREVQFALLTGIELDILAEKELLLNKDLQEVLNRDEGLYGVDEVMAYGICNLYGSIALTNFGFVDKEKVGIVAKLNNDQNQCNTFLDDLVGAIAASAASRFAHNQEAKI